MNFNLRVWRQEDPSSDGRFDLCEAREIPPDASFLEMLDIVNEELIGKSKDPIAFDHDCREGICGTCSLTIDGIPHGPGQGTTCQLYMRKFQDGATITIEPFRVGPFKVQRDLIVDRSAYDRIINVGGFITERTGGAPDANAIPIPKPVADVAMDAAACIGCGACAAACPNSSPMLFVGAKYTHLTSLPQGQPEKHRRVLTMVRKMDEEGFGGCTNFYECEAVCPAHIPVSVISKMNLAYAQAATRESIGLPV